MSTSQSLDTVSEPISAPGPAVVRQVPDVETALLYKTIHKWNQHVVYHSASIYRGINFWFGFDINIYKYTLAMLIRATVAEMKQSRVSPYSPHFVHKIIHSMEVCLPPESYETV